MIEGLEKSAVNISKMLKSISKGTTSRVKAVKGHLANTSTDTAKLEGMLTQPSVLGKDHALLRLASSKGALYQRPELKRMLAQIDKFEPGSPEYKSLMKQIEGTLYKGQGAVKSMVTPALKGTGSAIKYLWQKLTGRGPTTAVPETPERWDRIERLIASGGSNPTMKPSLKNMTQGKAIEPEPSYVSNVLRPNPSLPW